MGEEEEESGAVEMGFGILFKKRRKEVCREILEDCLRIGFKKRSCREGLALKGGGKRLCWISSTAIGCQVPFKVMF